MSALVFVAMMFCFNNVTRTADDVERLQGTWNLVAAKAGDRSFIDDPQAARRCVFKKDTVRLITSDGPARESLQFRLDTQAIPHRIDLFKQDEPQPRYLGIYVIEGNRFKLRYHVQKRPTSFDAPQPDQEPYDVILEFEKVKE